MTTARARERRLRPGSIWTRAGILLALLALVLAGCGGATTVPSSPETTGTPAVGSPAAESPANESPAAESPAGESPAAESPAAGEPSLDFTGPNGESPTPASELTLSPEEVEDIRAGSYTAALVWHENSVFIQTTERGLREKFDELGIEVVASTTAEFDAARQANNVETVLAQDPDIIVTIVVDPTSAAEAFRPAVEAGVKIVVLTVPPAGYTNGEIVGIVTAEATAYGRAAAEMLGEALGGEGEVGYLFHDADFWFTNARDQAFKDWLAYLYPDMEIVAEGGFTDPSRTEDIANAMLTQHPDITGMYTAWSVPAEGVVAALRNAGRPDVKVVTHDLDVNLALDMATGGNIAGFAAGPTVEAGRLLGVMAGYGMLEKEAPEMAVVAPVSVTAENLAEGWEAEFGEPLPQELVEALP